METSSLTTRDIWNMYLEAREENRLVQFLKHLSKPVVFTLAFGLGIAATLLYQELSPAQPRLRQDIRAGVIAVKPSFSQENLFNEIIGRNILCPNVVMAQAELESGFLSSGHAPKTNNLFGMRYPGQRKTTAIGIYLQGRDTIIYGTQDELRKYLKRPTYAVYEHWTDAVQDYKLWQDYSFKTKSKYIEFLSRVYATEPTYADRIREMTN